MENEKEIDRNQLNTSFKKWQAALQMNRKLQMNYREEIIRFKNSRDELKEEIKDIREKAFKEKEIRDKINKEVAQLKQDRSAANTQIVDLKSRRNAAWEQVKHIRNQLRDLINRQKDAKQKLKSTYPMMKQLEELDWVIMTKSMPFEKEQEIMDQIDQLINEVAKQKSYLIYDTVTLDFEEAKTQIDELKEVAQQFHDLMLQTVSDGKKIHACILDLVKESEKHHQIMQDYFDKTKPLMEKEGAAHQNMINNIKELELLKKGEEEIYKEIRAIEKKFAYLKHLETVKKIEAQEKLLNQKVQEALVKY
ncbi:MAG: hypothetical protein ACFFD2_04950, partial [Promethearchaeota archaeon]